MTLLICKQLMAPLFVTKLFVYKLQAINQRKQPRAVIPKIAIWQILYMFFSSRILKTWRSWRNGRCGTIWKSVLQKRHCFSASSFRDHCVHLPSYNIEKVLGWLLILSDVFEQHLYRTLYSMFPIPPWSSIYM